MHHENVYQLQSNHIIKAKKYFDLEKKYNIIRNIKINTKNIIF